MHLRKVTALAVLASGLVFCTTIQGQEAAAVAVRERLGQGYEQAPSRADLATLAPDLDATLVEIYRDPASGMLEKMRALDLLGGHPSDALHGLLVEEVERDGLDGTLRRRLLTATVDTYGESDPDLVARAMSRAFESDDTMLRYEAARTLDRISDPALATALGRKALEHESDPDVATTLRRALESRDEAVRP